MKKIIYTTIILSLTLFSCHKDHQKPTGKTQQITFNVTGFSQSTAPFNTVSGNASKHGRSLATLPLSAAITQLFCIVYDASGNFVHVVHQDTSAANFGQISDALAVGTYTVVFVGGQDDLYGYGTANDPQTFFGLSHDDVYYYGPSEVGNSTDEPTHFQDSFLKKETLTVASTTITQNVVLDRIDGELEINIEDAIPVNASSIVFNTVQGANEFILSTLTPFIYYDDTQYGYINLQSVFPASAIGHTNYNFTIPILNTVMPFAATLTCYDKSGKSIAIVNVPAITCEVNKRTLLTGKMFGGSGGGTGPGFNATIDTAWNPIKNNISFSSIKK